ncbi:MAG: LamG-like jellyroll fold domain-containing protein, partial [Limisphaerales bacterium]
QGSGSTYREVHAQQFTWTPGYNTPDLGYPVPDGVSLAVPSGEGMTSLTVGLGKVATFSCAAVGQRPFRYQWRFNGHSIPSATSSSYSVTNVQLNNIGGYSVIFSNAKGSATSGTSFLSISSPLTNATNAILDPPGMVNWWTCDDNLLDIYGPNNAAPHNSLTYVHGMGGLALNLNGTNSCALINGATNLPPPWTLCLWVNRQNAPGPSAALMGDGANVLKIEQYDGTRQVGVTVSGVADYLFSPGYSVPANTWTHLAFVGASNSVSLFTNGVLEGAVMVTNFPLARVCLGADLPGGDPADFLAGSLDEIQVFSRALTDGEINAIDRAGQAGLVRAPQFTRATVLGNGQVRFNLRGQTGKSVSIYFAHDFVNWLFFGALPNPTGATSFTDSTQPGPQKFYRAIQ